jgi:Tfp pilus assembly protein PilF
MITPLHWRKLMLKPFRLILVPALIGIFCWNASAQAGEICGSLTAGAVWATTKAIYGRVTLSGVDSSQKFPKVSVTMLFQGRSNASATVDRSGNYCFLDVPLGGVILVVDIEGVEAGRYDIQTTNIGQLRQDFDLSLGQKSAKPGSISAKYQYQRTGKNVELFDQANAFVKEKKPDKAIPIIKQIVESDPNDFVAWALLGSTYFEKNDLPSAETSFQKALALKGDFGPAMMNIGRIRLMQNQVEPAIEFLKNATLADPKYARPYQLLGEAYLMAKKGTLGVEALNEAIALDPVGMAECHLLIARLYDRAGAKPYASREYKSFLAKVPNHPDAKKFADYIKENPPIVE